MQTPYLRMSTVFQRCFVPCVLAALVLAAPARAQGVMNQAGLDTILDAAAADAEVVMIVPDMRAASDALAELAAMFGMEDPEAADLLGEFKREMGFERGLAEDGPAVIVLSDVSTAIQNNDEPTPVMLMPVDDYAAFVAQLGGNGGEAVTAVQLENEEGHAKSMAGYAVLGEDAATVEAYAAGNTGRALLDRVGAYADAAGEGAQFVVFIDVQALAPALKPKIDEGVAQFKEEMARNRDQMQAIPFDMTGVMTAYGELGKTLLDGVDCFMFTAGYSQAGVTVDYAVQLVEGSKIAGYLTGDAPQIGGLLNAMPHQPYIFAMAFDGKALKSDQLNEDLLTGFSNAAGESALVNGIVEYSRRTMGFSSQLNNMASAVYAPDMAAMMTGGFIKGLTVYDVEDPEAALAAWKTSVESMPGMLDGLREVPGAPAVDFKVSWTDNALSLDGHDVHQYDVKLDLPPELMQEMGPGAMFLGNAGQSGYLAVVGNRLVATTVLDANLVQQGITAAKEGNGLGTTAVIGNARQHLPDQPVMEAYLSLDGIANAANPFLMMFLAGQQIDVPADLAPVSMGLGVNGRALGFRVHAPNDTMRFVRDTIEQVNQMNQPQQGQPGGGQRAPF